MNEFDDGRGNAGPARGWMMGADEIVRRIGKGVRAALTTNERFLGAEQFAFENADIRPEYVATVKSKRS